MLTPGTRLGPYEVTGSLGKGGMGEVYRARDTRLERDVALKVLPDDVASDRDRMARFEREARLLAALNHPHIAAIYCIEDGGSSPALVMELAEGPTLSERIAAGPLPLDELLDLARQMAEALEYAHERGIVHRDLKPANVKLTPEGDVKLLDFGLAKALEAEATQPRNDYSESPTISHQATQVGVILGTASYMAPEQARGKTVDRRADIWAFGVVLLEMLTGRKTFTGESVTDVLAAVVTSEPDLSALSSTTPPAVRRLLKRCLDKDPKQRLRDMGEARILLEDPAGGVDEGAATGRRSLPWPSLLAGAAALLLLGAVVGFFADRLTLQESAGDLAVRQITFRRGSIITARFAPEGQTVIYGGTFDGGPLEAYSVRLDSRESRPLGLTGADVLAVSSTGELWAGRPLARYSRASRRPTGRRMARAWPSCAQPPGVGAWSSRWAPSFMRRQAGSAPPGFRRTGGTWPFSTIPTGATTLETSPSWTGRDTAAFLPRMPTTGLPGLRPATSCSTSWRTRTLSGRRTSRVSPGSSSRRWARFRSRTSLPTGGCCSRTGCGSAR